MKVFILKTRSLTQTAEEVLLLLLARMNDVHIFIVVNNYATYNLCKISSNHFSQFQLF